MASFRLGLVTMRCHKVEHRLSIDTDIDGAHGRPQYTNLSCSVKIKMFPFATAAVHIVYVKGRREDKTDKECF
jgi:hypothetical protein